MEPQISKTKQFRKLLHSSQVEFLLEAHNGLSARIVEEAGFKGIWASGLAISAALGVRDNNEASWTQVLDVVEFMSDATSIPILLDADTGYGNFNNVRRIVRKLEQRNVAAMCIEDKLFPKTNSFIKGERQALADVDEFSGKIKAAKDTQVDSDFCVVARVEAFIAGWGLGEALKRAEAYCRAGADAILMHSSKTVPDEILSFMKAWREPCPIIVVPTTYYGTPTRVFEQAGVSVVIWANHLVRSSIAAMQRTAQRINQESAVISVEDEVVPVKEVFRLQGADELMRAESEYLPVRGQRARAIVLAASRGADLGSLTDDVPKTMLAVAGKPILSRLLEHFNEAGISDVVVVAGYRPEAIDVQGIKLVINEDYAETKELTSLATAMQYLEGSVVICYGDILFKRYILMNLQGASGDVVIVVDADVSRAARPARYTDFVRCSRPYRWDFLENPVQLLEMEPTMSPEVADGEWIGLIKLSATGTEAVRRVVRELTANGSPKQVRMKDVFMGLIARGVAVQVMYINGHWLDVDNIQMFSLSMDF
ncbi:MAG: phosphoenolpyruvate mutase [Chloroflexi bacterium]|nr:phosphoenolpyruvate mutase [Chloroflexota bacterium]